MRIPRGPKGTPAAEFPTLRTSQIRAYGAGANPIDEYESLKGCPQQYKFKYVDRVVPSDGDRTNLSFGIAAHEALYLMEDEAIGPEEALERVWPPELPMEMWREAQKDLDDYMSRTSTLDEYATIAVEKELVAPLYVDEEFGPVWFAGRLDRLALDPAVVTMLHVIDYKTNRWPPSKEDVAKDVQLMSYDWLARANWSKLMPGVDSPPQVTVHLDAIKWFDVEWAYDDEDLEVWRSWAEAVARRILRDDEGKPVLNPGCTWCDYRDRCPAWRKLPEEEVSAKEALTEMSLDDAVGWMKQAKQRQSMLKAGIDDIKNRLEQRADVGPFDAGGRHFEWDTSFSNVADLQEVHRLLGPRFYDVANVSKAAIERTVNDPMLRQEVLNLFQRRATGKRLSETKAEE